MKSQNTEKLQPITCVCTNIKMTSRVVGRTYDVAVEKAGINIIQYSILTNTARYEPISQATLAKHLDMERTTLYRALDILERDGLLKTEPADEGVARLVRLTPHGRAILTAAQKHWSRLHESFIRKFGAKKLDEFNDMLGAVANHYRDIES